ncbi:MAG: hypothetical protein MJ252_15205 [archaeon]|nr:hypothetical protein [archaeon]
MEDNEIDQTPSERDIQKRHEKEKPIQIGSIIVGKHLTLRKCKVNFFLNSKRKTKILNMDFIPPIQANLDIRQLTEELIQNLQRDFQNYNPNIVLWNIFQCLQQEKTEDYLYLLQREIIFTSKNLLKFQIGNPDLVLTILINIFADESPEVQRYAEGIFEQEFLDILFNIIDNGCVGIKSTALWLLSNVLHAKVDIISPFLTYNERFVYKVLEIMSQLDLEKTYYLFTVGDGADYELVQSTTKFFYSICQVPQNTVFEQNTKRLFYQIFRFLIGFYQHNSELSAKIRCLQAMRNILRLEGRWRIYTVNVEDIIIDTYEEINDDFLKKLMSILTQENMLNQMDHSSILYLKNIASFFDSFMIYAPLNKYHSALNLGLIKFIMNVLKLMQNGQSNGVTKKEKQLVQIEFLRIMIDLCQSRRYFAVCVAESNIPHLLNFIIQRENSNDLFSAIVTLVLQCSMWNKKEVIEGFFAADVYGSIFKKLMSYECNRREIIIKVSMIHSTLTNYFNGDGEENFNDIGGETELPENVYKTLMYFEEEVSNKYNTDLGEDIQGVIAEEEIEEEDEF